MSPIKVVCGIIWNDKKVFIARRKPEKSLAGFWEFPGGKLEKEENPESALMRELNEELGMKVKVNSFFGSTIHHYSEFSIELEAYDCEFISKTGVMTDHDDCAFVRPNELSNYKLAAADLFFVNKLC